MSFTRAFFLPVLAFLGSAPLVASDLLADRPWLDDLYSWNETHDLTGGKTVSPPTSGAYAVGNGRSFGMLGLADPCWTLTDLYGASYQEPALGTLRMTVRSGGKDLRFTKQKIGWVRRSGVVRTTAEGGSLRVDVVDFAPASPMTEDWDNPSALIRGVRVVNGGSAPVKEVTIEWRLSRGWSVTGGASVSEGVFTFEQKATRAKVDTFWRLSGLGLPVGVEAWADAKGLKLSFGDIAPGQVAEVFVALASSSTTKGLDETWSALERTGPEDWLDRTRDFWAAWHSRGVQFAGDARLTDLFEIESQIFKIQKAATGAFSPLIGYSYAWIRDHNGPIRWFLATGKWDEASSAVDFFPAVAASLGSLPNSVRVDRLKGPSEKDLSNIHVEHAETPNWVILQHWWRYLSNGDLSPIRRRWDLLKRCLSGQVGDQGKYMFHRDETYLWCLMSRTFDRVAFPNEYLTTYAYSVDSGFDFAAASDALAHLGRRLGKDAEADEIDRWGQAARAAVEKTFWNESDGYYLPAQSFLGPMYPAPYANILINPFWCGYARGVGDPLGPTPEAEVRAVLSLESGRRFLGRSDGFWKTTPSVDYFVGMNPGQLLWSLCEARSSHAGDAWRAVMRSATPSGEFAEMYDGKYRPYNPPAWGEGTSGRVRPWEGGLNTEALFHYLTGFRPFAEQSRVSLAPHLPEGQDVFEASRLRVGDAFLNFRLSRRDRRSYALRLKLEKGRSLECSVDLWGVDKRLAEASCDGEVDWKKKPGGEREDGRLVLTLKEGEERTISWREEGDRLNAGSTETKKYDPKPFHFPPGDVVLFTSPSAVLAGRKPVVPRKFPVGALDEVKLLEDLGFKVCAVDVDLPLRPADVAACLVDGQGGPKASLAVFGRGAFTPGKHSFKPGAFWADPIIGKALEDFLRGGGSVVFGPEAHGGRRSVPAYLADMSRGGWDWVPKEGIAKRTDGGGTMEALDMLDVGEVESEQSHGVTIDGSLGAERIELSEGHPEGKKVKDEGRWFKGSYRFAFKTKPGVFQQIRVRVNTGRNIQGLTLWAEKAGRWQRLGSRTRNADGPPAWLTLWYDLPPDELMGVKTAFKLTSEAGADVNAYRVWMAVKNEKGGLLANLADVTTLKEKEGAVALQTTGKGWVSAVGVENDKNASLLILRRAGEGVLAKTELPLSSIEGLLGSLLDKEKAERLREALPK